MPRERVFLFFCLKKFIPRVLKALDENNTVTLKKPNFISIFKQPTFVKQRNLISEFQKRTEIKKF